jgi:DNA-binding FadR family transcriptional regulator
MLRIQTTKQNPDVLEVRLEHHRIYEALFQRDIETGVKSVREHLTASQNRVTQEVI